MTGDQSDENIQDDHLGMAAENDDSRAELSSRRAGRRDSLQAVHGVVWCLSGTEPCLLFRTAFHRSL